MKETAARIVQSAVLILLALIASSCKPVDGEEQSRQNTTAYLGGQITLGQTLVARHDGLNGIELYIEPDEPGNGTLNLELHRSAHGAVVDNHPLAVTNLSLDEVNSPGYYQLTFPPQKRSNQVDYYLRLVIQGDGSLQLGTAGGRTYLDGALYRKDSPTQNKQLTFNLLYHPWQASWGCIKEIITWLGYLFVSAYLFFLPGYTLLNLTLDTRMAMRSWAIKIPLSFGLGLAFYPVLFALANLIRLKSGGLTAWLTPLACLLLWGWARLRQRSKLTQTTSDPESSVNSQISIWPDITLLIIVVLIIGVRFWSIRSLEGPMWGDSYQHTLIAQLILDHGGLFSSWEPYIPYHSLTTHFGFSAFSALFAWITHMDILSATLWVGQLLNILAVLTLYPLAVKITNGNRWAGVGAVLVAGLLSPTPAEYLNWGRYAQLAGQVILPVALWLLWNCLEGIQAEDQHNHRAFSLSGSLKAPYNLLLAGIALAGMTLSYYRMPFFYAAFVLILLIGWCVPKWKGESRSWRNALIRLSIIALIGILLFLPWGSRLLGSNLAATAGTNLATESAIEKITTELNHWQQVSRYLPTYLLLCAALSLVWSLFQKKWFIALIPLWPGLLVLYLLGNLINLPGALLMQSFVILISLYLPMSLMAGWAIGQISIILQKQMEPKALPIYSLVLVLFALWGVRSEHLRPNPAKYAMITRPDHHAMHWIRDNTPDNALFLVQGFRVYQDWTAVGSDAGWWIPILANRQNTMPPQYALLSEAPNPPDYSQKVVDLVGQLEEDPLPSQQSIAALCNWGITHIFSGQLQGLVGAGATQLFNPEDLSDSSAFQLIYHRDRVHLFSLNPDACQSSP
jgi:hypothetical protein